MSIKLNKLVLALPLVILGFIIFYRQNVFAGGITIGNDEGGVCNFEDIDMNGFEHNHSLIPILHVSRISPPTGVISYSVVDQQQAWLSNFRILEDDIIYCNEIWFGESGFSGFVSGSYPLNPDVPVELAYLETCTINLFASQRYINSFGYEHCYDSQLQATVYLFRQFNISVIEQEGLPGDVIDVEDAPDLFNTFDGSSIDINTYL